MSEAIRKARCICGEEHEIIDFIDGVEIVVCPIAPPGQWTLINPGYVRSSHPDHAEGPDPGWETS